MFRDTKEELERLQQQLLEDEEIPQLTPEEEEALVMERNIFDLVSEEESGEHEGAYSNFANDYQAEAYNTDQSDVDLEELSEAVMEPRKENLTGLLILMMVLLAGIVGILGYWVLLYLGVLG